MSDPYQNKPKTLSEANDWHELSFQISIDEPVDWDKVDLRKWAHNVAKYTALVLAKSTVDTDAIDPENQESIKTLIMAIRASRVTFLDDATLHKMIEEFGD